jgi:hypothetical protein
MFSSLNFITFELFRKPLLLYFTQLFILNKVHECVHLLRFQLFEYTLIIDLLDVCVNSIINPNDSIIMKGYKSLSHTQIDNGEYITLVKNWE